MQAATPNMKHATPEPFVPPPLVNQPLILAAGLAFLLVANLGPILIGVTALALSIFLPYCYRTTDYPEERRRLYHEFQQRSDPLIKKVLSVPDEVNLEERYWINSR